MYYAARVWGEYMRSIGYRVRSIGRFGRNCAVRTTGNLLLLLCFAMLGASPTLANSQQCIALTKQLNSLPKGNSANYRKYDRAAKRQIAELSKIKKLRARAKCGILPSRQCRNLGNSIDKMLSNHRKLISIRNQFDNSSSAKRSSIKRKMAALRCGSRSIIKTVRRSPNGKLLSTNSPGASMGGYRTMCVRTCDGYYFPVSHASTPNQLARDEQICQAQCPASEARLYFYENGTQETEDMVSLRGEPYKALPTAFDYRTQPRKPACSCGAANPRVAGMAFPEGGLAAGTGPAASNLDEFLRRLPPPTTRPNLFADVETQFDQTSGLTLDMIKRFVKPQVNEVQLSATNRNVRVVGPEFLPDPSTAIDLRAPAPTRVQ